MRQSYSRRAHHQSSSRHFLWIVAIIVVLLIVWGLKALGTSSEKKSESDASILFSPLNEESLVYISSNGSSKTQITSSQALYTSDAYILVEKGGGVGTLGKTRIDLDEKTELGFTHSSGTGEIFTLDRGRAWVTGGEYGTIIELKNLSARLNNGSVAMLEQSNVIYSTVYAIHGDIDIITSVGQYTLKHGERIMVSASDLSSVQTKLSDLVGEIDETVAQIPLFIRNDGRSFLETSDKKDAPETKNEDKTDSNTASTSTAIGPWIEITQPLDGSTLKTEKVTITGNILNTDLKRVTFNDIDASVSPVNQTFVLQDFSLQADINNIVFKVYDTTNTLVSRGVLIIYGPKNSGTSTTLVPKTYPISSKDFVITSPNKNPYATTESYVRVQGTVPANTVKYIIVNDYRLQRYVPNSTTWYYHANADIGTMKDGMNLYNIKFYDANDTLLYTQLFTIIKDDKNSTEETPSLSQ